MLATHHPALTVVTSVHTITTAGQPLQRPHWLWKGFTQLVAPFRFSSPRPGFLVCKLSTPLQLLSQFGKVGSLGTPGSAHGESHAQQQTACRSHLSARILCQSVRTDSCARVMLAAPGIHFYEGPPIAPRISRYDPGRHLEYSGQSKKKQRPQKRMRN